MPQQNPEKFWMTSIGQIRRDQEEVVLEIDAPFRPALQDLEQFSHVMVFWWAEEFDNDEDRAKCLIKPPYAPERAMGIFATRSPFRPNPLAMTTCPIISVDRDAGRVVVGDIDAFDGTPIVDLKAYLPICDRVRDVRVPPWLADWPEWTPEKGMRLMDPK
jgi:tRNA-Thr(GGU) m(6)t(6)A37 methyltransferase TsaA